MSSLSPYLLNTLPAVRLTGRVGTRRGPTGRVVEGRVSNPAHAPALEVRLTLRDPKTGQRILPAYYSDNYFSLLPGESREFRIACAAIKGQPRVDLDGWNVQRVSLR